MDALRLLVFSFLLTFGLFAEDRLQVLQEKAESGNAQAAYELAEALYWADGVERDLEQSASYALVGSLKNNPLAQYRHAVHLLLGQGMEQDVKKGFKLLTKAIPGLLKLAEKKNPDALYKTGKLYQLGLINSNHFNPDDKRALANFRAAAALGHARAAYLAGYMVRLGLGTSQNNTKALQLFKESADAGFADAAFHVWIMHNVSGKEIVSEKDAVRYLKQAAGSGLMLAEWKYGMVLAEGKLGLKLDKKTAVPWIRKAANQGNAECQFLLGLLYATGSKESGQKEDAKEAFFWLTLATRAAENQTRVKAQNHLKKVRSKIDPLVQLDLLKRANEFKAEETAVTTNSSLGLEGADNSIQESLRLDNLTRVAGFGDAEAMFSLGMFYSDKREHKKSEYWLEKAANKGFVDAMEALGQKYVLGDFGGEPIYQKGSHWLKKAAENNSLEAMTSLGGMALRGNLPGSKPSQAIEWFRKAAEKGNAEAQTRLGGLLYEGDVVKQDIKGAMEWMHKAAAQHYSSAEGSLAVMFAQGLVDGPDHSKAAKWARRGAMQGDGLAQRTLGLLYLEGKGVLPSKLPKRGDHKRHAFKWLTLAKRGGVSDMDRALDYLQKEMEPRDIKRALNEASQFVAQNQYFPEKEIVIAQAGDLDMLIEEANQGKAQSQVELARRFAEGDGMKPDPIESYMWYTLAFNQGLEEALLDRSKMTKAHGLELDDIIAAKKKVRNFKPMP